MGWADRIRRRARRALDRFTGEHSAEAPEHVVPFERNVVVDPEKEVVRPRLNRPAGGEAPGDDDA